jgi:hypothetical protein
MNMNHIVLAIGEPHRLNVTVTHDDDGEPVSVAALSDADYRRTVGGWQGIKRMNREGRVRRVHHLEYDRQRIGPSVDALGRRIMLVDALRALALAGGRVSWRRLERMFLFRHHAEAAWSDLLDMAEAGQVRTVQTTH